MCTVTYPVECTPTAIRPNTSDRFLSSLKNTHHKGMLMQIINPFFVNLNVDHSVLLHLVHFSTPIPIPIPPLLPVRIRLGCHYHTTSLYGVHATASLALSPTPHSANSMKSKKLVLHLQSHNNLRQPHKSYRISDLEHGGSNQAQPSNFNHPSHVTYRHRQVT